MRLDVAVRIASDVTSMMDVLPRERSAGSVIFQSAASAYTLCWKQPAIKSLLQQVSQQPVTGKS